MTTKKEHKQPYDMITSTQDTHSGTPLANVVGHESQKKELLLVLDWFKNLDYWKSRKVSTPRGVLLYGAPGNGKSLLMREAIKYTGLPAFIFKGDSDNICGGLEETFKKAKETGHSIIVIDELDLLIDKDPKVTRTLQENLDGVDSSDEVLVLAATNDIWAIPDPLTRNGRLEKILKIPYPTGEEAVDLLKKHFEEFGISLPKDIDTDALSLTLANIPCAGVKTIACDVVLRNGFDNITTEMIIDSIYRITNHVQDENNNKKIYSIAVHEAGHCVMANQYPQFFKITRLDINQDGGKLATKQVVEDYWPYDKTIADIKISLAGLLAQKVICGMGSSGCESDIQSARESAWDIINECGYSSCADAVPVIKGYARSREESDAKRNRNIKKADKIIRKCEKETIKFLKKNKQLVIKIADALFEKKFLSSNEVLSIINS